MGVLGTGLSIANRLAEALPVQEAKLSTQRRLGAPEVEILGTQGNLAITYGELGQLEKALSMERDIHSGYLKLNGEEHTDTIHAANNYAGSLLDLDHLEEAKSLLRKNMPVARRVLGKNHELTLTLRSMYAQTLYKDDGATLDDLREAVTTLEETERIARRVLGGAHPLTSAIEDGLRDARAALRPRDTLVHEELVQDAFHTARIELAQERSELAQDA